MPLNTRLLKIEISKQFEPELRRRIRSLVRLDFNAKRDQFFEEFDNHPVTKELKAGPDGLSSNSVIATETGGNLFSLIGFESSEDPAGTLRDFLKENIELGDTRKAVSKGDTLEYSTPVSYPSADEVDKAMEAEVPLEWTERSFTNLISSGITGIPRYLFSLTRAFHNSRSGRAIQVKKSIRGGSVPRIPYISALLAQFGRLIKGGR